MNATKRNLLIITSIISLLVLQSCANLKNLANAFANMKKLEFKLQNIDNFRLNGIDLTNKKSLSNFSVTDGISLYQAYHSKKIPVSFILNVAARNPNDGKGGTQNTTSTLTSLDWRLYIDNKLTVSGLINNPIKIPGTGKTTIIPLNISLDLYKFFKDKSYDDIIKLALAMGGIKGNTSRIKLDIKPSVSTPFGKMVYPGRITVIDKEFRGN